MGSTLNHGKIVLVTGINGYIASNLGLDLLKKGYTVRGTSRSVASKATLLDGPFRGFEDYFEYYHVPDITVPGAFDEAVKGIRRTRAPRAYKTKVAD